VAILPVAILHLVKCASGKDFLRLRLAYDSNCFHAVCCGVVHARRERFKRSSGYCQIILALFSNYFSLSHFSLIL